MKMNKKSYKIIAFLFFDFFIIICYTQTIIGDSWVGGYMKKVIVELRNFSKSYGDKNWYFFAECFPYIDKFKPSRCEFEWNSLESMMEWVSRCIKESKFYISELEGVYDESFIEILMSFNL